MDQDKNRRTKFVGVSLFVPILTLSIALLALVQGQAAGRSGLALTMMAAQTNSITSNSLLFSPAVTYNAGGAFSMSAAVADLNGDGKPDVIVGNFPGPLGILLGRARTPRKSYRAQVIGPRLAALPLPNGQRTTRPPIGREVSVYRPNNRRALRPRTAASQACSGSASSMSFRGCGSHRKG